MVSLLVSAFQEMERASEGVATLLNNVWHSMVIKFGCVSCRIVWIKFTVSTVKACVVVGYSSNEGNGEERERFWNDLARTVDKVGNGYRLCVLGDLNEGIGERMRASAFRILGESDNGRRRVELCAKRDLCLGNTYFELKSLRKYERVPRGKMERK